MRLTDVNLGAVVPRSTWQVGVTSITPTWVNPVVRQGDMYEMSRLR